MTKIKVYYFKNEKDIPFDDQQDIIIFGQPKLSFIEKYYVCVYDIEEKRKIKDVMSYLRYTAQKLTFQGGPLMTNEKKAYLESIGTHTGIAVGDIIQIADEYYAVEYDKCTKIKQ